MATLFSVEATENQINTLLGSIDYSYRYNGRKFIVEDKASQELLRAVVDAKFEYWWDKVKFVHNPVIAKQIEIVQEIEKITLYDLFEGDEGLIYYTFLSMVKGQYAFEYDGTLYNITRPPELLQSLYICSSVYVQELWNNIPLHSSSLESRVRHTAESIGENIWVERVD